MVLMDSEIPDLYLEKHRSLKSPGHLATRPAMHVSLTPGTAAHSTVLSLALSAFTDCLHQAQEPDSPRSLTLQGTSQYFPPRYVGPASKLSDYRLLPTKAGRGGKRNPDPHGKVGVQKYPSQVPKGRKMQKRNRPHKGRREQSEWLENPELVWTALSQMVGPQTDLDYYKKAE